MEKNLKAVIRVGIFFRDTERSGGWRIDTGYC